MVLKRHEVNDDNLVIHALTIPVKTKTRHRDVGLLAPGKDLFIASSLKLFLPFSDVAGQCRGPWGKIAKCSEKKAHVSFFFFSSLPQLFSLCRLDFTGLDEMLMWHKCCTLGICKLFGTWPCALQSRTVHTSIRGLHPNLFTKCLCHRCTLAFSSRSIMSE